MNTVIFYKAFPKVKSKKEGLFVIHYYTDTTNDVKSQYIFQGWFKFDTLIVCIRTRPILSNGYWLWLLDFFKRNFIPLPNKELANSHISDKIPYGL